MALWYSRYFNNRYFDMIYAHVHPYTLYLYDNIYYDVATGANHDWFYTDSESDTESGSESIDM